jgi:hypothetical protein
MEVHPVVAGAPPRPDQLARRRPDDGRDLDRAAFLMATGFLIVCLFAGFLVPKEGSAASVEEIGGEERIAVSAPEVSTPEGLPA